MFLSDPGSFVGGKTKENPDMQSEHVGMWVEYAWVNDRVLGRRRGVGPDVRSVVSWSNEKRGAVVLPVLSRQP